MDKKEYFKHKSLTSEKSIKRNSDSKIKEKRNKSIVSDLLNEQSKRSRTENNWGKRKNKPKNQETQQERRPDRTIQRPNSN